MGKSPQTPAVYDEIYRSGGNAGSYLLPYVRTRYYALFKQVFRSIKALGSRGVLEVGCGTGGLADMILKRTNMIYRGFDFSPVAIEKARELTGRDELFSVANALDAGSYNHGKAFDTIVCTEVLEHIEEDLRVLALWPAGCRCVLSVPNFDASNHERFFHDESEVRKRYRDAVSIERIDRVKVPNLPDNHWRKQAEAFWAQRRRRKGLLDLLGFGDFDRVGGWFVLTGRVSQ